METANGPVDFTLIITYGVEMTITLLLAFGFYLLRVKYSPIDLKVWIASNAVSLGISFGIVWILAFGVVFSPNISAILGAIGFNAGQSAAAMALVIAGFTIGTTSEPAV